jgi:hypothetical protein
MTIFLFIIVASPPITVAWILIVLHFKVNAKHLSNSGCRGKFIVSLADHSCLEKMLSNIKM